MIPKLAIKVLSWFKGNIKGLAVIIISILTAFLFYYRNQVANMSNEVNRLTNNYLYYANRASLSEDRNRVLQLTVNDLKVALDSLIQATEAIRQDLGIKVKDVRQILSILQVIMHDTIVTVPRNDFSVVIKPNDLTSISIVKLDTILNHSIDIYNTLYLFIIHNKEYRHKYKNWFQRLLHLDYRKYRYNKYLIENTNNLIKTEDTRVIDIIQ